MDEHRGPAWQAASAPRRVITDPQDILVESGVEVKRFRVGLQRRDLSIRLTDGATRRIYAAIDKFSEKHSCEAWYVLDYSTQEAVIMISGESMTLAAWAEREEMV